MARGFGSLGFWNLIPGAPRGCSRADKARALLAMWHEGRIEELTPDEPTNAADIFRAMVLELAVGDGDTSLEVAELVEKTLPKWAYAVLDPVHVYSGDGAGRGARRQIAWRRLENLCRAYDRGAVLDTGKQLPVSTLVERLAHDVEEDSQLKAGVSYLRGDAPAFERTIHKWRQKPGYRSDIDAARVSWESSQDT
jgi:hypothetical protein